MCSKFLKFLFARKFEERRRTIRTRRLWLLFLDRPGHPGSRSSPTPYHNRGGVGLASRDDFRRTKRRAALADITPRRHFHTKRSDNAKFYASGGPLRIPALLTVAPPPSYPARGAPESMNSNMIMRTSAGESSRGRRRLIGSSTVEGWIYGNVPGYPLILGPIWGYLRSDYDSCFSR